MRSRGGRIFLAGASVAVGRRLCHFLVASGWTVIGTTRRPEKAAQLGGIGVEEDGTVCSAKARRVLGWEPMFRLKGA